MKNFLETTKADIIRQAENLAEQVNDYQLIRAWMNNRTSEISLSATQQSKLERWQFVYNQLSTGKFTDREVCMQLITHFNLPENTAYLDIRQSKELMATTMNFNKRFKILVDIELLDLMKLKARNASNLDAYAKLQKVQNDLYKLIPDDEDKPIDHFEPRQNIIQYKPSLLGIAPIAEHRMKELVDELKRDFNIQDVDYEMLVKDAN